VDAVGTRTDRQDRRHSTAQHGAAHQLPPGREAMQTDIQKGGAPLKKREVGDTKHQAAPPVRSAAATLETTFNAKCTRSTSCQACELSPHTAITHTHTYQSQPAPRIWDTRDKRHSSKPAGASGVASPRPAKHSTPPLSLSLQPLAMSGQNTHGNQRSHCSQPPAQPLLSQQLISTCPTLGSSFLRQLKPLASLWLLRV
jgi:hypothetical protein